MLGHAARWGGVGPGGAGALLELIPLEIEPSPPVWRVRFSIQPELLLETILGVGPSLRHTFDVTVRLGLYYDSG